MGILLLTQPPLPALFAAEIARLAPESEVFDDIATAPPERVRTILVWRLENGVASRFPHLELVCASSAGVEKIVQATDLPERVPVTRTVDPAQSVQIAQYVALMVLRHARGLEHYREQQAARTWKRQPPPPPGSVTVGLLGLGATGQVVGRAMVELGFRVVGWSRTPRAIAGIECLHGPAAFTRCLAQSDVVVCLLPLTAQTSGILDARAFAAMRPGACVVNVARGGHVVEVDLIAALSGGHLGAAVLDVQSVEPMPPDHALWAVPGVTVTPHIAAQPSPATVVEQLLENMRRQRAGEPLLNVVDRTRGY